MLLLAFLLLFRILADANHFKKRTEMQNFKYFLGEYAKLAIMLARHAKQLPEMSRYDPGTLGSAPTTPAVNDASSATKVASTLCR